MKSPIKIYGYWDEGFVLDNHMLKSSFLGYDKTGKEKFENIRTELGELLYEFKYKQNKKVLVNIMNIIIPFLDKWNLKNKINLVVPVPPSNNYRIYQPVFELTKEIAKYLHKDYNLHLLTKINNLQKKDGYNIEGTIKLTNNISGLYNVLLIDDLISSGATLNEVCKVLKSNAKVRHIYCLVLTKTKG